MPSIPSAVQAVHRDKTSGSEGVAEHAVTALADLALAESASPVFHQRIREAALELGRARPSLPVVRNRVAHLAGVLLDLQAPNARIVPVALQTWRAERRKTIDRLQAEAVEELAGTRAVATLSRSTTVDAVVRGLPGARVRVVASPEAATVVNNWRLQGRDAEVVADARDAVDGADAVVVGADAVFPDGTVWNRAGTDALFDAARRAGVPCYVATATSKVEPWLGPDDMDGEGLFATAPAPDRFLTEHGVLDPGDLAQHVERIAEARRRIGDTQ